MSTPIAITTPTGRIVGGSLYKPNDKDFDGKPLLVKSGPNTGKPRLEYFLAVAIAKGAEVGQPHGPLNWIHTEWGKLIVQAGLAFDAQAFNKPTFAWKITDGDSTVPNKRGNKPCEAEGYPGHWVLKMSSGFAPKVCNKDGSAYIVEPDVVKPGHYVQVWLQADGNGNANNPGVFLNLGVVSHQGYGPEIVTSGVDASKVGFGQGAAAALPPGASAVPIAGFTAPQVPGASPASPVPVVPHAATAATPPVAAVSTPAPSVAPNPGFLQVPGAPAAAMPLPPGPTRTMLGQAAQFGYDAMRAQGWSDDQLVAAGHMRIG